MHDFVVFLYLLLRCAWYEFLRCDIILICTMLVCFDMNEVAFTYLLRYELNVKVCGLIKGLLRMYEVMGIHMFIALVVKDWGHEQGLIMMDVKRSKIMYNLK